jgi:hypothetical protein
VVCLPGFARTAADFHELALGAVAGRGEAAARAGAGLSRTRPPTYDKDWKNYDIRVELDDLMQVLTAAGIEAASSSAPRAAGC